MKKQIRRIAPFHAAKFTAVLYALLSFPIVVLLALSGDSQMSGMMILLFPVMYLIGGFVFTLLFTWLYNLVAGWVGGIELTLTDVDGND